jgi:hypothetical protein
METMQPVLLIFWQFLYRFPLWLRMAGFSVCVSIIGGVVLFKVLPLILFVAENYLIKLLVLFFGIVLMPGWIYNMAIRKKGREPGSFVHIIEKIFSSILENIDQGLKIIGKFRDDHEKREKIKKAYKWIWVTGAVLLILMVNTNIKYSKEWYNLEQALGAKGVIANNLLIK